MAAPEDQPAPEPQAGAAPAPDGGLPDLAWLAAVEAELDDVERALARLEEGTYGTCEVCGAALSDALLAERPTARRCEAHAA